MKKKKRNPQDATLRNITALKKRVKELEQISVQLLSDVRFLFKFKADKRKK
jgi:hypothetical protein